MISATWDGVGKRTETYCALRELYSSAANEAYKHITAPDASPVKSRWHLHSTSTEDRDVMTTWATNDGMRIMAESWGDRDADGRMQNHTFTFWIEKGTP